jgi:hypothetical protein
MTYKFLLTDNLTNFKITVPSEFDTMYVTLHRPESPDTLTIYHIQNKKSPLHRNTTFKESENVDPSPISIINVFNSQSELKFKSSMEKLNFYSICVSDSLAIKIKKIEGEYAILGFSSPPWNYFYAWRKFHANDIEVKFASRDTAIFYEASEKILNSIVIN